MPARPPAPLPYSWFTIRYVPGFYLMLPPDPPFLEMPLPCWRYPSDQHRWVGLYFRCLPPEVRQCTMLGAHGKGQKGSYPSGPFDYN